MSRTLACFILSVIQTVCGSCLLILTVLKAKYKEEYEPCADFTVNSYVVSIFHLLAGIFGAIAYNPRRLPNVNRTCVLLYVTTCMFLLFTFNPNEKTCIVLLGEQLKDEKTSHFAISLIKLLLSFGTQLAAVLGVAFSCLDLKSFLAQETVNNLDKTGGKQYIQLPEARRHVQEAQGTGEKIVVITLPYTEKVVYAVPEESYVIRREGAYVTPAGNTRLTMFFPSYNKFQMD